MKKKLSDIAKKMLAVCCVVILIVTLSLIAFQRIANIEEEKCWQVLDGSAQAINNEIIIRFEDNINILKLASDAMVQENKIHSPEAITAHINAFQPMTLFSRIDLLYPDNTLLLQTGEVRNVADFMSFDQLTLAGEHMSARTVDVADALTPVVHYFVPVVEDGKTAAILVGVIDCTALSDIFQPTAYDGNAYTCIVDSSDGSFLLDEWHGIAGNISEIQISKVKKDFAHVNLIADISNAQTGAIAYVYAANGKNSYLYYTPVGIFDWELLVVVPEDVAFSSLLKIHHTLSLIGIVEALFLIFYITWTLLDANRLAKNKLETERQLMTSNTLVNCIATLSNYSEIDGSINNLLEIITQYFDAERTYLFEINYETHTASNTYECAARGVTKKIDFQQNLSLDTLQFWLEKFQTSGLFHITNLETDVEKDSDAYAFFSKEHIQSLIAVPLVEKDAIIGFLGVDNPKSNCHDFFLLSSITYFLMDNLDKRKKQTILERLSFEDTLTKIYNRNKFNEVVDDYTVTPPTALGIAYFDLNGLKVMNDKFGHKAGDNLIRNAAQNIHLVFGDHSFRIGGDEFAVIVADVDEDTFHKEVAQVCQLMELKQISVSVGVSWHSADNNITTQLHEADEKMYEHKKKHYAETGLDRRKR